MDNNDTVAKLQKATDEAEAEMKRLKLAYDDSDTAVKAAKDLLKQLDEEEQRRIKVTDTKLPELLAGHTAVEEAYETARKRFETNKRYLDMYLQKATTMPSESK